MPLLSSLAKVEVDGSTLTRAPRDRRRATSPTSARTPAVLSVIKGINEPRYPSMKGIMGAKKKPVDAKDAAALGLDARRIGLAGAKTRVLSARVRRSRARPA